MSTAGQSQNEHDQIDMWVYSERKKNVELRKLSGMELVSRVIMKGKLI